MTCSLVHHGLPQTSTLVIYMNCLRRKDHAWVDTQLTCRVWDKTDLPWASDDHPMLERTHDLHIGAPWSATHFYTFYVHELFGEDHAWVDTQLTCRVCAKSDLPWAIDDRPMLEIAHDLHIDAPWSDTIVHL